MKKILTLSLAAAMLASMAVVANANPASDHSITAAYGTPVIDGQMDEIWNTAEMQVQDSFRSGTETDAKAEFRVMYDDNYIYVLEYVPDNTLWTSDLTLATYQYDTTEVCVSLINSANTSYDETCEFWVGITPYGVRNTESSKATALLGGGTDVNDAEYLDVHTSLENDPENDTAEGYWVEWAFNAKAIKEDLVMDEGTTIGLEISVNDNAEYNNRTMCMGWADATDGASGNPSVFGTVVFGPKAGAEEAPAEEAPVEEAPVEEAPVEEAPVEEAPVEEAPVEEAPAEEEIVEAPAEETVEAPAEVTAPQTFDMGVIAAVAALVSAAGYALTKKR